VKKRDARDLASKLAWLMDNPTQRAEMGQRGRRRYEQLFTAECFETQLKDILSKCFSSAT